MGASPDTNRFFEKVFFDVNWVDIVFPIGVDKAAISERNDYGYGCILSVYEKIKARLSAENICISDTTVRPRKDRYLFEYGADGTHWPRCSDYY